MFMLFPFCSISNGLFVTEMMAKYEFDNGFEFSFAFAGKMTEIPLWWKEISCIRKTFPCYEFKYIKQNLILFYIMPGV